MVANGTGIVEGDELMGPSTLHDHWIPKLTLILLGYASVMLPLYCLIRFVKRRCKDSDHNFRQSCIQKFLRAFAIGHPEYRLVGNESMTSCSSDSNAEEGKEGGAGSPATIKARFFQDCFRVFVYFLGIQVTLVCMGFFQERIITRGYPRIGDPSQEDKFDDAQFLVFANRIVAFLLAGGCLFYSWRRQPVHIPPLYTHSFTSISNTISSWCQYEALKYVSFPTQTVCKASKVIPTMLMGRLLRKQRYSGVEYFMALTLVFGASIFFLSINSSSGGGAESVTRHHSTTASGLVLMLGYLMLDAFTPNFQKKLLEARVSCCQMMFYVNAFSAFLCLASLLQQMTLFSSAGFIFTHSGILRDCFLLSLGSALGQVFIYMTIDEFGPVALSVMMTLRQIFSIILSSVYFSHPISLLGILGLAVVFGSIFVDIYRKYFCNSTTRKVRR